MMKSYAKMEKDQFDTIKKNKAADPAKFIDERKWWFFLSGNLSTVSLCATVIWELENPDCAVNCTSFNERAILPL